MKNMNHYIIFYITEFLFFSNEKIYIFQLLKYKYFY